MSRYYKSNAIYDYISTNKIIRFEYVSGNCWQLVYGNKKGDPLLLVFAYGYDRRLDVESFSPEIIRGHKTFKEVAQKAKLPLLFIGFDSAEMEINSITTSTDLKQFETISLKSLADLFLSYNLPIRQSQTAKYLNDKTSSAYHKWQRDRLGNDIVVSDADLWFKDKNDNPSIVFELKRSIISLEKWKPFKDDYPNFILIAKLCLRAGIRFFIIYNVRKKNPVNDMIDNINLFEIKYDNDRLVIGDSQIFPIERIIR